MALGALAWWVLSRGIFFFPVHIEERLESRWSSVLLQTGIRDRDIESTTREEHAEHGGRWIQTSRTVRTPPEIHVDSLKKALSSAASALGGEVRLREESQGTWILEVWAQGRLLEKIILKGPAAHRVALVIDDVSGTSDNLEKYFHLGVPLTFAILPEGKRSQGFAHHLAQKEGSYEYILHLPLEPHKSRPEKKPWTILVSMPAPEKERLLQQHLNAVPGTRGVSNHTGSAFTEDKNSMTLVLRTLKAKHLFFFDSHTSQKTLGYKTAKSMGIPTTLNRVFLDNRDDSPYIADQLKILLDVSKKRPATAAIGHYRRRHLAEEIAKIIPEFKKNDIEFVTLSQVLEPTANPG